MATKIPSLPIATLLADYSQWLGFIMASRRTIRQYDRRLMQIGTRFADLSAWANYLRDCMHERNQFLGNLAILLTSKLAQLRQEPTDGELARQLTQAHPTMQSVIDQLTDAFTEVEESYRTLLTFQTNAPPTPEQNRRNYYA